MSKLSDGFPVCESPSRPFEVVATSEYIETLCYELGVLASSSGLDILAYLLGMAEQEAQIVRQRHESKACKDGSVLQQS